MAISTQGVIESTKTNIVSLIKGSGDVVSGIVDTVSRTVSNLVKDTGKTGAALIYSIQDIMGVTIYEFVEGGKSVEDGVRALVIGILKGLKSTGDEGLLTIVTLSGSIIKTAAHAEADMAVATKGLLKGVLYSAKEMEIDSEAAVSAAATGAVRSAYEVSAEAGDKVKGAAVGSIDGVKVVLGEPFASVKK